MIELTISDEQKISAYRADPEGTPKGAVVVLQEVFGLDSHIRKAADSFAAQGYVAIAPALFDKVKSNIELPYNENGKAEGAALSEQLGTEWSLAAIQATVDAVKDAGKVAVVGYNWGGLLAYLAANKVNGVACAIGYYPKGVQDFLMEKRRVPTLIHFGEADPAIPEAEMIQFRARRPDVSAFSYPNAAEGFDFEGAPGYDAGAAGAAQERTLFWISQHVVGAAPAQMKNAGAYAQAKEDKKKKKKSGGDDMGPPMD